MIKLKALSDVNTEQDHLVIEMTQREVIEDEWPKNSLESIRVRWLWTVKEVEGILNYKFSNKKLLEQAFTHNSFSNKEPSSRHLEYIGDFVLNFFLTKE